MTLIPYYDFEPFFFVFQKNISVKFIFIMYFLYFKTITFSVLCLCNKFVNCIVIFENKLNVYILVFLGNLLT